MKLASLKGPRDGKLIVVSRDLKRAIAALGPDELRVLREWFGRLDADDWDRQIGADARSGKLAQLAERALRDHEAGRSTKV